MRDPIPLPHQFDRSGRDLGEPELARLRQVIDSGCLICTRGAQTPALERGFAELYGVPFARALGSGTAAVHVAVAAVDPRPGDEIISTPVTDFGAIAPILFHGAIPVFADLDPTSLNMTPETVEARITPRTRAVVVAHLFGTAADVEGIVELCRPRGITVIEDSAQAFLSHQNGRLLGTIGDIGCFSFQQGKHITCGEGGMVITSSPELHQKMWLFTNKGWGYTDPGPDHWLLALNYRITELQSAVLVPQLEKLPSIVSRRQRAAARLSEALASVPGVAHPPPLPGCDHSYWRYIFHVDDAEVPGGAGALGAWLSRHGCPANAHYVGRPAYALHVMQQQAMFGGSGFPFAGAHLSEEGSVQARGVWRDEDFPGTFAGLKSVVVLPWNELYTTEHVDFIGERIALGVQALRSGEGGNP